MKGLKQYIEEQLSDVKTSWHPKKGLFMGNDPQEIADYLLKNSKDEQQAMSRLCFYMNRAGSKLTNKTVLNQAKAIIKKSKKVEEKLVVNKDYAPVIKPDRAVALTGLIWNNKFNENIAFISVLQEITTRSDCAYSKDNVLKYKYNDGYYHYELEQDTLSIYVVLLMGDEGYTFLENIKNDIPEKLNLNDYVKSMPNKDINLCTCDKETKKYVLYTKDDIEKLITELTQ